MLGDAIASKKVIFVRKKEAKSEKSFLVSLTNSLTEYLNCLYVYQVSLYANKLQSDLTKLLGTKGSRQKKKKRIFYGQADPKKIFLFLRVIVGRI